MLSLTYIASTKAKALAHAGGAEAEGAAEGEAEGLRGALQGGGLKVRVKGASGGPWAYPQQGICYLGVHLQWSVQPVHRGEQGGL